MKYRIIISYIRPNAIIEDNVCSYTCFDVKDIKELSSYLVNWKSTGASDIKIIGASKI